MKSPLPWPIVVLAACALPRPVLAQYSASGKWDTVISKDMPGFDDGPKVQATHSILLRDTRPGKAMVLMVWVTQSNQPCGPRHNTVNDPDCMIAEIDLTKEPGATNGYVTRRVWSNLLMNNINLSNPPACIQPTDPIEWNFECSGHAMDKSGMVYFFGGQADPKEYNPDPNEPSHQYNIDSHNLVARFDPVQAAKFPDQDSNPPVWTPMDPMLDSDGVSRIDRYYATASTLANNTILVCSGQGSEPASQGAHIPGIFDPAKAPGQQWSLLTAGPFPGQLMPTYPFTFLRYPEADVFYACSRHSFDENSREFDQADPATGWNIYPNPPPPGRTKVNFPGVSAVTFFKRTGTTWDQYVMRAAGDPTTYAGEDQPHYYADRVETIRLTTPDDEWRTRDPLGRTRDWFYLACLPDGHILAVGGNRPIKHDADRGTSCQFYSNCWVYPDRYRPCFAAVLETEWTLPTDWPNDQRWSDLAAMPSSPSENEGGKAHHASCLLLPDSRLWLAGGEFDTGSGNTEQKDALVFTPPYLYQYNSDIPIGTQRPVIASVPPNFIPSQTFDITIDQSQGIHSTDITDACLIRLGAATHSFDQSARYVPLRIMSYPNNGTVRVKSPPSYAITPPGYYMLFVLRARPGDPSGMLVPSVAAMVKVDVAVQGPPPMP